MIISVEKAKELVDVKGWTDAKIERKLKAIEQTIRAYTNNNFQKRAYRVAASIVGGQFVALDSVPFKVGDTVQISESDLNEGLFTVVSAYDTIMTVEEDVTDEEEILVTKVEYPEDIVDCALNLLEWEVNYRAKVGIKSETLSRHSTTYEDSTTMFMGYPTGVLSGAKLHRKVRF